MPNQSYTTVGWTSFNIPAEVKALRNIEIRGGGSPGRAAGLVTGQLTVKPNQTLLIFVGGAGQANSGATGGAGGAGGTSFGISAGAGGRGGDGSGGTRGGHGGGSLSMIWLREAGKPDKLIAVAGGSGGDSGDDGHGGRGGAGTGEDGHRGSAGGASGWTAATGGRPNQGGFGGISPRGAAHNGFDASVDRYGQGGRGRNDEFGGGGGGSGYYSGGGGQGGGSAGGGYAGGGGAGGSNFTGGLNSGAQSLQGGGGTANGRVAFFWQTDDTNHPPTVPSDIKVNGKNENPGMSAGSLHRVEIKAKVSDPDGHAVRLVVQYSTNKNFNNPTTVKTDLKAVGNDNTAVLSQVLEGLAGGTHYYVRLWSEDSKGLRSLNYNAVDFWTNRKPGAPLLKRPPNYMMFPDTATIDFAWDPQDADGGGQSAFALRYRVMATPTADPGEWKFVRKPNSDPKATLVISSEPSWSIPGETFQPNYTYEWTVRTRDNFGKWSDWSSSRTFTTTSVRTPPELIKVGAEAAVEEGIDHTFKWRHVDWRTGQVQYTADFRFRVRNDNIHDDDAVWYTIFGTEDDPAERNQKLVPAQYDFGAGLQNTFTAGVPYEWQVRTYSGTDSTNPSHWSEKSRFTCVPQAGENLPDEFTEEGIAAGPLGCGNNRVMVVTRPTRDEDGNFVQYRLGEITPIAQLQWTRVRDDISACTLTTIEFGDDCGELLASLRCWQHELIVYRDGVRVWEGPITRVAYFTDHVEIDAKDPMAYVYRRVMRVGYNDTYLTLHGVVVNNEGRSVVERATIITQNALSYDDPNILGFLTRIDAADDAMQARSIAAYQKTAWEEIDDLSATAGLDYTTVGRRIIFNDVHNPIGKLPVMGVGDFSEDPVVTEYGMQLTNVFIVNSQKGQVGIAYPVAPADETSTVGPNLLSKGQSDMNTNPPEYHWMDAFGSYDIGGPITRTTEQVSQGQYAVKAVFSGSAKGYCAMTLVTGFTIGQRYILSGDIYIADGSPDANIEAVFIDSGPIITTRDEWVRTSVVFTAYSTQMYFGTRVRPGGGGAVYFDNFVIKMLDSGAFTDDTFTQPNYYPFMEQLSSAYGESADDAKKTVNADKKLTLADKLATQASKHIANRWPAPVMVRVPDNALLSPELQVGINQLIPGVWIPLRATGTLREITQWQKLDSVTVMQSGDQPEQIAVVLLPAPQNREENPDSGSGSLDSTDGT